ncbi:Neprilysin cd10, peptidase, partial [Globisporangium polare]
MERNATRESTPLLYGTDSVQLQDEGRAARAGASRRWKFAASGAALLCAGTLVSSKLQMNDSSSSSSSLNRIIDAGVSMNKQQQSVDKALIADDETPVDPATADFFKSMKAFKNENADPCVDFYEYACGGWLASNEIPSDRPEIDSAFY